MAVHLGTDPCYKHAEIIPLMRRRATLSFLSHIGRFPIRSLLLYLLRVYEILNCPPLDLYAGADYITHTATLHPHPHPHPPLFLSTRLHPLSSILFPRPSIDICICISTPICRYLSVSFSTSLCAQTGRWISRCSAIGTVVFQGSIVGNA